MKSLVVSQDSFDAASTRLRGLVRSLLDNQGPQIANFETAANRVFQVTEVVFLLLSPDPEPGLAILPKLRRETGGLLLAVGKANEPKLILRTLQTGADHYLDENDLEGGLKAVLLRRQSSREIPVIAGNLIALLSTNGGAGASSLAVNIAAVLAKDHGKVGLVDMNTGRGDLAALLDLKPAFHLTDVCSNAGRVDQGMFEKILTKHASGIHLLAAPQEFSDNKNVTPQGVKMALGLARTLFPHTVVDLEDCFHDEQVVALKQASMVLLISRLDFTSLRHARRILKHLNHLEVPRKNVRMVVNRHGQPNELPVDEAEDALGDKLSLFVPDDPKTFNIANNTGVPAVLKTPQAKVSQSIAQLAKKAVEAVAAERPIPAVATR